MNLSVHWWTPLKLGLKVLEMAQSIKCLLCKHRNLSFIPRSHVKKKKQALWCMRVFLATARREAERQADSQSSLASCPSLLGEVPGHWETPISNKRCEVPKESHPRLSSDLHTHVRTSTQAPCPPKMSSSSRHNSQPPKQKVEHTVSKLITSELVTARIWDPSQGWTGVSHRATPGSSRPWDFGCMFKSPRQVCCLHSSSHPGLHSEDTRDGNLVTHSLHSVALIAIRWELRFL